MKDLGFVGLALVVAACGARLAPSAKPAPAPAETPSREGVTAVRVLNQPERNAPDVQAKVVDLSPAYSVEENALPVYPHEALRASCPDGVVAVRVTVDTKGLPTLLRDVPGRPVPADACHAAFREAAVRALRDWQFLAARREVRHESADVDGNGRPDYTWLVPEPVTIFVDLEFAFRIVEGRGVVAPKGGDADAP